MSEIAGWIAPMATTIAAILVAANFGARVTGFGFIVFSIGSIAWGVVALDSGQANLLWQNIILLVINLIGIWRWLGLRARYERGAARATRATARDGH